MNKININFLLDKRCIHKNGTYSVTLAIYSNGDSRRFTFNNKVLLTEKDWIKMNSPRLKNKSLIEIKNYIEQERVRALGIIDQLGDDFSFDGFRSFFRGTKMTKEKSYSVYDLFDEHIASIRENGQIGTAGSYDSAMKSLKMFSPKLSFKEVTPDFLRKYECWMIENGNSMNTVGIYLRSLRVIMNISKSKELITEKMYPFGSRYNGKYEIPAGNSIKKALQKEEVKKIKNAKCINPEEDFARDMWMFSFYCNGMDMADIFLLKYKNFANGFFHFYRKKTLHSSRLQDSIEVFISEPVSAIIDRWGNKDKSGNNYVFNIYTLSMDTEEMFRQKQLKTRSINGYMKRLGKRLGIKVSISTSVARHSYATISKNNGIPVDEISESLGHSDVKTTRHYLGSFSKEHKIKTAKKIADLFK